MTDISIIEIKAHCSDPERVRVYLQSKNADFRGIDHQTDTYFQVPRGRLKLREGTIENALIYYERKNQRGPKQSDVILTQTRPDSTLKALLSHALGILVVVEKQREIYFIDNVKFHIDAVNGLGHFIEIEAIDQDRMLGTGQLLSQCQFYREALLITPQDLIALSYSELLLKKIEAYETP